MKTTKSVEDSWPSVGLAYDFVKPSYEWLQNRLDAVNSRIEFLLTLSSSITVATPVFAKALLTDIYFGSCWFVAAIVVFVSIALIGLIGRMFSGLKLISPQKLYDGWLSWSEWEFKKNAIYWAGKHFQLNASLVNKKANFGVVMTALLVIEVVLIVLWVASSS
jgi:hypothetical protein